MGLDRAATEAMLDRQLLAMRPWASPGRARFDLPGPNSRAGADSDALEAFARSFLGAGFRLAGGSSDPENIAEWYAAGLAAGTDPGSGEAWPTLVDTGQARVEAAAISLALHESRAQIWDRLDPAVQERVIAWLAPSATESYPDCNWLWFRSVTQAFLRSVGADHDQAGIDETIEHTDRWYLGDGWYTDGDRWGITRNVDWYSPWVMSLFSLWYCRISAGEPGIDGLLARYRERLALMLPRLQHLYGADGAPLFQGRSLVYRAATAGALWLGPLFDVDTVAPGRIRELATSTLDHFDRHGAHDENGLLTLGWLGAFPQMRQHYSGPGSPYWASLGFAGLALPAGHEVWTAPDPGAPTGVETVLEPAGWLVSGRADDGIVVVVNHGSDHHAAEGTEDVLYSRLGYSTVTAPAEGSPVGDQQVVLLGAAGPVSVRHPLHLAGSGPGWFASTWGDDRVQLWAASTSRDGYEVRVVRCSGELEGLDLAVSGWAVPSVPDRYARRVRVGLDDLSGGRDRHQGPVADSVFGSGSTVEWVQGPASAQPVVTGIWLAADDAIAPTGPASITVSAEAVEVVWSDQDVVRIPLDA